MRVLTALLFSLAAADLDDSIQQDIPGTCQDGLGDDCIEGYTSLLQESVNLMGHQRDAAHGVLSGRRSGKGSSINHSGGDDEGGTKSVKSSDQELLASFNHSGKEITWILIGAAMLAAVFYFACWRSAAETHAAHGLLARGSPQLQRRNSNALTWLVNNPDSIEEMEQRIHDPLEEDTYSLAIALLVRDLRSVNLGEGKQSLKASRIAYSIGLIVLTSGLTLSLLICVKQFVTPSQVADIRDAYAKFEEVMYDNHTYLNAMGKKRGMPGYFNASAFDALSDDDRQNACNIPFSQLNFMFIILAIWSITCMASLKKCFETFMALIIFAETKDDLKDCLTYWKDAMVDKSPRHGESEEQKGVPIQVITGLTMKLKALLVLCVFLPEFLTTSYLLWLGCRWLAATNDFGNIVCNAVALEFILQLKCMLFYALASERNKRDLANTGIAPPWGKEAAGYGVYFNTVIWAFLAFVWVYLYIFHLQQVLPDYKWDVHQVCDRWLRDILKASGGDDGD